MTVSAQQSEPELPPAIDAAPTPFPPDFLSELSKPKVQMPDPSQGMIRLDVIVRDKSGNPVSGLEQENFILRDNGEPKKIVTFQEFDGVTRKPDPPVEIVLVIDELNLAPMQISAAEREIENFLRQNRGLLTLPVSIYRVSDDGLSASQGPTTEGNLLADEVAHRSEPRVVFRTPIRRVEPYELPPESRFDPGRPHGEPWDPLGAIVIEERRRPGRKVMFWLGLGWQGSHLNDRDLFEELTEFSTRLREARITLWCVTRWPYPLRGLAGPVLGTGPLAGAAWPDNGVTNRNFLTPVRSANDVVLGNLAHAVIATQSGGGILEAASDLSALMEKQVADANAFYTLTFDPPRTNMPDEYHDLRVEVKKPDMVAHTDTGYYDEPVFYDQRSAEVEHITERQLEEVLKTAQDSSRTNLAQRLSGMELIQRISSAKLATLQRELKGRRIREALVALADQSSFLAPPTDDISAAAPPDAATQRLMISRTIDYVNETVPRLPNFFADRTTTLYHESPPKRGQTWKTAIGDRSLDLTETSKVTVLYREGKETMEGEVTTGKKLKTGERSLDTVGTFGPILTMVLVGQRHRTAN